MFELGQRYKIFYRDGSAVFVEGYNGSDPSKYVAIGTFDGDVFRPIRYGLSGTAHFAKFRDVYLLNPYTQEYQHMDEHKFEYGVFSESPGGKYKAVKVNTESGLPMGGAGRRRRRSTRRHQRKASHSKRGSRKN